MELTEKAKQVAMDNGADLVGVVSIDNLDEHSEDIHNILPGVKNVIVVPAKHSLAAIQSPNNQMGQLYTIHACNESARSTQQTSRFLESEGFPAAAAPAFIPIDTQTPKKGMRGQHFQIWFSLFCELHQQLASKITS
jgi:hypothetical protein